MQLHDYLFPGNDFTGTNSKVVCIGVFTGKRYPHFFQFETVVSKVNGKMYAVIEYLAKDNSYAVMDIDDFERGCTVCNWLTKPENIESVCVDII